MPCLRLYVLVSCLFVSPSLFPCLSPSLYSSSSLSLLCLCLQVAEAALEAEKAKQPWNVDTLSKPGFDHSAINKSKSKWEQERDLTEEEKSTRMAKFIKGKWEKEEGGGHNRRGKGPQDGQVYQRYVGRKEKRKARDLTKEKKATRVAKFIKGIGRSLKSAPQNATS